MALRLSRPSENQVTSCFLPVRLGRSAPRRATESVPHPLSVLYGKQRKPVFKKHHPSRGNLVPSSDNTQSSLPLTFGLKTQMSQMKVCVCKIWCFHDTHYEECRLLGYKNPFRTSQETHYISATESSRLMLCTFWDFHGGDYEECRLLGY
jgi:hypothetical protein